MSESLKQKTAKGVLWSSVEQFSVQIIQFVLGLIMARILSPQDYGLVGMILVFTVIAQVFVESGFANALIRKQNRTEVDYSTAFYFNIVVGIVAYFVLFFVSPYIADFYDEPLLEPLTKVVALTVFINSLGIVPRARYTINVDFKTQAKATTTSVLISGIIGIWMAYTGYGVWAIVWQSVIRNALNVLLLWIFAKWLPLLQFSWQSFREMWSFGYKLLLSGLIDRIYSNIYQLVIGKVFSAQDLGNYTRAHQFASFPSSNINGIISRVTYPILSSIQDDDVRLERVYRKYLRLSAFIVFPLMVGLSALSEPLILYILTDKWSAAVILLQIICFNMMWYPIHAINLNLLQVKGRSDLFLKLEIIKKFIGVAILCITVPIGLVAMCIGGIFSSILCLVVNTHYTGKLINVGFWLQMRDLLPTLLLSLAMGAVVVLSVWFIPTNLLKLIVGVIVGVIFYIFVARLFKMEELSDLLSLVKRKK
ncbi:MAG: lipopolysaccharide biosynthesis protein [Paludibacteraceae bacterium]|nr:lipopolysaccharide biosynthesis protein [Paludibacteraceae bacterium]